MNIIVAIKKFFADLGKKPVHKMTVEEVVKHLNTTFKQRKEQVIAERNVIRQVFPMQQKEFTMRLEKASTDLHLKSMLALVTNMKKNWMFWTEGERIVQECEKSIANLQDLTNTHEALFPQQHMQALGINEAYQKQVQALQKSNALTAKHLNYLQADAEFIKKDLIKRAKALLESDQAKNMSFETLFAQKKEWIKAEVIEVLNFQSP